MILRFQISGMTCAACSARVEKVTRAVPGVRRADVNLLAGTMMVEADSPAAAEPIIAAVRASGYGAMPAGQAPRFTGKAYNARITAPATAGRNSSSFAMYATGRGI